MTDQITVIVAVASLVVAVAALGVAFVTYFRNRKSEQIRIAREIVDKIEIDFRKAFEIDPAANWPTTGSDAQKRKFTYDYLVLLGFMTINIRDLTYLIQQKEIYNKSVLKAYHKKIIHYLNYLDGEYKWAEESSQSQLMAKWPEYHDDVKSLRKVWESLYVTS